MLRHIYPLNSKVRGPWWPVPYAETTLKSHEMRPRTFILAAGLLAVAVGSAFAAGDDPSSAPPISCGNGVPGGVNCIASKKELKQARNAFHEGVKFQQRRQLEDAFAQFDTASRLAPQNKQFLTARELVKAQLVFNHVERGNVLLWANSRPLAAAEFRAALDLDGENQFARERLDEATRGLAPPLPRVSPVRLANSVKSANPGMGEPPSTTAETFAACFWNCPRLME